MDVDMPGAIESALQLLREGNIQRADATLSSTLSAYEQEQQAKGLAPPPPPRTPPELVLAALTIIASRMGNPADLSQILDELARPEA